MLKYSLLISNFLEKKISSQEREELLIWVLEADEHMNIFKNALRDFFEDKTQSFDVDAAFRQFMASVKSKEKPKRSYARFLKYAAIVLVLLSIGFLTKNQFGKSTSNGVIKLVEKKNSTPSKNSIVIKMADGSVKAIQADVDEVIKDASGNIIANKNHNSLSFDNITDHKEEVGVEERFNEVSIPFGKKFQLKLSDGTKVWLNSGSKLRFPQKFSSSKKQRIVFLEGEAFFDVTANKEMPFIVNTNELDIKVLGTEFNVSSYENDKYVSTTLVEGAVSVYETRAPENSMKLTRSYQAKYDKFGNNLSKRIVNTDDFTAWMNNKLVINNLTFSEILVKLERRHQVKIINNVDALNNMIFKGEFENEDVESILETISLSTPFHFKLKQNTITITN